MATLLIATLVVASITFPLICENEMVGIRMTSIILSKVEFMTIRF